ncbi:unnamed protein product [Pedinophyceae sp. YPF-701]|nr:unnamed protein product [Pedinophyceae sp. YPF-701]
MGALTVRPVTTCVARAPARHHAALRTANAARRPLCKPVRSIPISGPPGNSQDDKPEIPEAVRKESAALCEAMKGKIGEALKTDLVSVQDVYGDARHVSIVVVSQEFEGLRSMQRQRKVFKAIWEELQERVHAVDDMMCKTPAEAAEATK